MRMRIEDGSYAVHRCVIVRCTEHSARREVLCLDKFEHAL